MAKIDMRNPNVQAAFQEEKERALSGKGQSRFNLADTEEMAEARDQGYIIGLQAAAIRDALNPNSFEPETSVSSTQPTEYQNHTSSWEFICPFCDEITLSVNNSKCFKCHKIIPQKYWENMKKKQSKATVWNIIIGPVAMLVYSLTFFLLAKEAIFHGGIFSIMGIVWSLVSIISIIISLAKLGARGYTSTNFFVILPIIGTIYFTYWWMIASINPPISWGGFQSFMTSGFSFIGVLLCEIIWVSGVSNVKPRKFKIK